MKKTQPIAKTSFKGLINLQSQKLPQKKSRSRSIRDRNNTSKNNFSVSRATQHQESRILQKQTRNREGTWAQGTMRNEDLGYDNRRKMSQKQGIVRFDDNSESNLSRESGNGKGNRDGNRNDSRNERNSNNQSRNQGSMEKIRQNMRKQSQQIKQKIRQRSQSRRKRNGSQKTSNSHNSREPQNSLQTHKAPHHQQQHQQQKYAMNQIINMKNRIQALQYHYGNFVKQVRAGENKENYEGNNGTFGEGSEVGKQEQFRERAQEMNNLLETFHITFRENLAKTQQEINKKIDQYKNYHSNINNNTPINPSHSNQHSPSLNSIIKKLQTQFCLQDIKSDTLPPYISNKTINSKSESFFTYVREDKSLGFGDLEKRLLLAGERLLK